MRIIYVVLIALGLSGCGTSQKVRQQQRDQAVASSGLFCDFVNGDEFKDVEVELNLGLAKRCDGSKPISMTSYKNSSDVVGIVYCCTAAHKDKAAMRHVPSNRSPASTKPAAPGDESNLLD